MSEVKVDTEKLADGLIAGIEETKTIFAYTPPEHRLRLAPCGLVSSAIHQYLLDRGISSELVISSPNFPFDKEKQHVFPLIGEPSADRTIVDASYSQFLGYVGLTTGYEVRRNTNVFPSEAIIDFKVSERGMVVDWLTNVAADFRRQRTHYDKNWYQDIGSKPLSKYVPAVINNYYSQIWAAENLQPWSPPDYAIEDGSVVAKHIPEDSITIA